MTSWRPPGSILEAPDSILEAPRLDLGRFWHDFFEILGQNAKKAKNAKNACQNKTAITNPPRVGGRRCSPPGGFQSAAHRRCAVRAGSPAKSSSAKCQDQSQMANLKGQAHSARLKSYTPLFFSPQEGWDDRNPVTKFAPSAFSGLLNRFFCSPRVCFKNDFEKTSKKLRKS